MGPARERLQEEAFAALASVHKGNFYRFGFGAFSPETLFTMPGLFDISLFIAIPLAFLASGAVGIAIGLVFPQKRS